VPGPWRWRLQASFRVGDEVRSFKPQFLDSEEEAEQARLATIDTLWHMADHGLDIRPERVTAAAAAAEALRVAAEAGPDQAWVADDLKLPD
jgi:hypothetical protein